MAWQSGNEYIFKKWLQEKRYKELISCAHGGWFEEKTFLEPLAAFFIKEKELDYLKFLCERGIRYDIEYNLLFWIKNAKETGCMISDDIISRFDLHAYHTTKTRNTIGETAKWRKEVLRKLNRYITYLEGTEISFDYLEAVKAIRDKVIDLSIRKSDLKSIRT